ncbi:MAG: ABC transporter substrate-binding protein [Thermoanaerobaculia bacterium]|nr:ABC transporter substrate-binding protein [Thermoanaerobaculia bacterium]
MRRRSAFAAFLLLLLFFPPSACRPVEAPIEEEVDALPAEGGTLLRHLSGDVSTLNFVRHNTLNEKYVLSCLHDPLLSWNDSLELVPGLAESWDVEDAGRKFTFKLDPRANFSDGTPVKASDVVFTLKKIVDPESRSAQYAGLFSGLDLSRTRAVDEKTVEVVFSIARASQIQAFNIPVLPEHVYGEGEFSEHDFDVVGTGPYVLERRVPGQEIRLKRRDNYWRKSPFIEEIVFRVIGDDTTAWNAMRRGELDAMKISTDRWVEAKASPAASRIMDFYVFYELEYSFIAWNNRHPALSDRRVRRAMSMALDRQSLIESLYQGTARIITGPFTPDQPYYNAQVEPIQYDLEQAASLLEQAGWTDSDGDGIRDRGGEPLSIEMFLSAGSTFSQQAAQVLQEALAQIGVELEITPLERATFFSRIIEGDFEAAFLSWGIDFDPDQFTVFHSSQFPPSGQNFVHYSNPVADELIVEGRNELDREERIEIYQRLHEVLAEDQPYTWVVQESKKWAVNKRIRNVEVAQGIGLFLWYPDSRAWWIPEILQKNEQTAEE